MNKTLVLGSGISALAYLFYNPEAFAIAGDQPGGLFAKSTMGPQYIWVTESTKRLMADLDIAPKTRTIRIGYLYKGAVMSAEHFARTEIFDKIRLAYSMKTRGTPPSPSHMSSGQTEFQVYTMGVKQLIEILTARVGLRIIHKAAQMVAMYNHMVVCRDGVFDYQTLVSTVPAPTFLRLIGHEARIPELVAYDKAYHRSSATPLERAAIEDGFDYLYCPDEDESHHRVTLQGGSGCEPSVIREYTMAPNGKWLIPLGAEHHRQGQIVGGREVFEGLPPSVELLGRYAEWRHDRRLEQVLEIVQ